MSYEVHPLAELIPGMSDAEYRELRDDIEANGMAEPITLYEGKVLDGRHRARACEELGIEAKTRQHEGDDPVRRVISLNVHRRHLTTVQKASIAKAAMPHYQEAAKKRQAEGGSKAAPGRPAERPGRNAQTSPATGHRARDEAAADVGVSGRTVAQLQRVEKEAPDLYERVQRDEMSVSAAEVELTERQRGSRPHRPAPSLARTDRQRDITEAAQRRLDKALTHIDGICGALADADLSRAVTTASEEQIKNWRSTVNRASRTMADLKRTLKKEQV